MKSRLTALLCSIAMLTFAMQAAADARFPGHELTRSVIKSKEKADRLFENGDYERAFFIYENDLAPIGDKYAQYMIGYMYLVGKGVAEDAVLASAWYRLAAERGHEPFSEASEALYASLDEQQQNLSDRAYLQLRPEYGDIWVVKRMLEADLDTLVKREPPLSIDEPGGRFNVAGVENDPSYYRLVNERLESRIGYLESLLAEDTSIPAADRSDFDALLRRANEEVRAYRGD